jgi:hypothetical protein
MHVFSGMGFGRGKGRENGEELYSYTVLYIHGEEAIVILYMGPGMEILSFSAFLIPFLLLIMITYAVLLVPQCSIIIARFLVPLFQHRIPDSVWQGSSQIC